MLSVVLHSVNAAERLAKERTAYRPGIRSPARLKLKPKLTLEMVVTGG